jgi:hypothetical protein
VTFASFAVPEKPQLSTGAAARLVNNFANTNASAIMQKNFALRANSGAQVISSDTIEDIMLFAMWRFLATACIAFGCTFDAP